MDARTQQELLIAGLRIVASSETILDPVAFEELGRVLRRAFPFFHIALTKAETPGYFRVLALTRGEGEAALPFRTRLQSSPSIYATLYERGEPYLATDLGSGIALERSGAQLGFGSYAVFPIRAPAAGGAVGPVIAGFLAAFKDPRGAESLPADFVRELLSGFGASVARGLEARREARAGRILEATGDAMLAWDSEGRLVDLNGAAERLLGAAKFEVLGTSMQALFGAIPIGPSSGQRLTLLTKGDKKVTVAATVSPVQGDPLVFAHALLRDLSDVVEAEQRAADRLAQLRELTEQHTLLLDNAPLLIFRLDPETHEVLYLNRHAEHLFGVPAARALETHGFLLDAHIDQEGALAFEEAVIVAKLGQVMPPYEARLRREHGQSITARGTVYPILGAGGRVVGIEGILLDVTGERAARSRLVQADRLATVGMLAAGVAHEINNPAAFMLLGLDVLSKTLAAQSSSLPPEVASQVDQLLTDLRETARRIVHIARDMRLFASPPAAQAGRRMLMDVARTVESALTITRAQIVEKAELEVDIEPDLPLVAMDDGRLGQVLVNVLVNAAQAIGEARAARGTGPDRVRITVRATDADVEISIEDTGVGMRPEVLERAFTPFFTTKHPELGTGLGLVISRQIVEAAGGTITAESPGTLGDRPCGACFRIRLPAQSVPEAPQSGAVIARVGSQRVRVLVVEDEVLLGKALADRLSQSHEVTIVTSGEEALGALQRGTFDVVLCDLKMPTLGGEELYRRVVEAVPEMRRRFVFMTGVGFGPELEGFLDEVRAPLLEKPFPIVRALEVIADVHAGAASSDGGRPPALRPSRSS